MFKAAQTQLHMWVWLEKISVDRPHLFFLQMIKYMNQRTRQTAPITWNKY